MAVAVVQALTFDVFGTVVDWRGSIISELRQFFQPRAVERDWDRFTDCWRGGYAPAMDLVRHGQLPWMTIDQLHRRILDQLLEEFEITGLSEADKLHLNRVWRRLRPWDDAVEGIGQLKRRYVVATLSNGNVSLLTDMAKASGLAWDVILSAELAGHYKPDAEAYLTAARLLDLPPSQIMMVSAHVSDLHAAARVGFRTAYVPRPLEWGPNGRVELKPDPPFDIQATDFLDLARQLA